MFEYVCILIVHIDHVISCQSHRCKYSIHSLAFVTLHIQPDVVGHICPKEVAAIFSSVLSRPRCTPEETMMKMETKI